MKGQMEKKGISEVPTSMVTRKEEENLRMDFANTILRVVEKELSIAPRLRISLEEGNHA